MANVLELLQNPFFVKYGFVGLFLNGLLSSIIPIPTELTMSALLLAGESKELVLLTLLSSSVIGGFIGYYIGQGGDRFSHWLKRPHSIHEEEVHHRLLAKYGWLIIFFSPWIPIAGDLIPMIAGSTRFNFHKFWISMIIGKAVKVTVIVYLGSILLRLIFQ